MYSILPFLFVLGVLVFVHELGHFLLARWHGVRVLTFSLGFGPKLVSIKRGDTEYCISIVPLGGYVKMAGEMSDYLTPATPIERKEDEFLSKTKWQRFQIFLAGPIMNILLALVVLTFVFYNGATRPVYLEKPVVVGSVDKGSAAEKAGIKPGDLIVTVSGKPVETWDKLDMQVLPRAGEEVPILVHRDGQALTIRVTPDTRTEFKVGDLGVMPVLHPQIQSVNPGEPADKAGLLAGDVVLAVGGEPVAQPELMKKINESANVPIVLTIDRNGQKRDITVTPYQQGTVGLMGVSLSAGEERHIDPTFPQAFKMSVDRNLEWSTLIFQTFAGLFSGQASLKQLSGPVGIARLAGGAAKIGWSALFSMMAMISLNLGILNLLPIPMLDGGHIFIMALEGVARRDFSMRVKEKLLMAGFLVIMAIMVTVIYNDLTRIEWIERLMPWR